MKAEDKQFMLKAALAELEGLLRNHQTVYGSSERPFKVVESADIQARIEAIKVELKNS